MIRKFMDSKFCVIESKIKVFLTMPGVCLHFTVVVFPDHTRLLFFVMWLVKQIYGLRCQQFTCKWYILGTLISNRLKMATKGLLCWCDLGQG